MFKSLFFFLFSKFFEGNEMKTTVYTASTPGAKPVDGPVVRGTFLQALGDLIKILLFFIAVSGVIVAMSVHRYAS